MAALHGNEACVCVCVCLQPVGRGWFGETLKPLITQAILWVVVTPVVLVSAGYYSLEECPLPPWAFFQCPQFWPLGFGEIPPNGLETELPVRVESAHPPPLPCSAWPAGGGT